MVLMGVAHLSEKMGGAVADVGDPRSANRRKLPPGTAPYVVVALVCAVTGVAALFWRPPVAMLLWGVTALFGVYVWSFNRHWTRRRDDFEQRQADDLEHLQGSLTTGELGPAEGREKRAEIDARLSPDDEYVQAKGARPRFGSKPVLILGWFVTFSGFAMIVLMSSLGPWMMALGLAIAVSSLFVRTRDRQMLKDQMDRARSARKR